MSERREGRGVENKQSDEGGSERKRDRKEKRCLREGNLEASER